MGSLQSHAYVHLWVNLQCHSFLSKDRSSRLDSHKKGSFLITFDWGCKQRCFNVHLTLIHIPLDKHWSWNSVMCRLRLSSQELPKMGISNKLQPKVQIYLCSYILFCFFPSLWSALISVIFRRCRDKSRRKGTGLGLA